MSGLKSIKVAGQSRRSEMMRETVGGEKPTVTLKDTRSLRVIQYAKLSWRRSSTFTHIPNMKFSTLLSYPHLENHHFRHHKLTSTTKTSLPSLLPSIMPRWKKPGPFRDFPKRVKRDRTPDSSSVDVIQGKKLKTEDPVLDENIEDMNESVSTSL